MDNSVLIIGKNDNGKTAYLKYTDLTVEELGFINQTKTIVMDGLFYEVKSLHYGINQPTFILVEFSEDKYYEYYKEYLDKEDN